MSKLRSDGEPSGGSTRTVDDDRLRRLDVLHSRAAKWNDDSSAAGAETDRGQCASNRNEA